MRVVLHHDGTRIEAVEAEIVRAPWSTCPGAEAKARDTFTGMALEEVARAGGKKLNCTHLFDLAQWAAAHALDSKPLRYDVEVSDPVDGVRQLRLSLDSVLAMHWVERDNVLAEPGDLAGKSLFQLRDWIADLDPVETEKAKLLQWAAIVAHGRMIPLERQSDATKIPPNCFTFQPERAVHAQRVGEIRDFAALREAPLTDGVCKNAPDTLYSKQA